MWVTRDVDWLRERGEWAAVRGAVCVDSVRQVLDPAGGEPKTRTRRSDYLTSLDPRTPGQDAAFFAERIREHWGIENKLHGPLDVVFREDESRLRQGHAAENLSRPRRMAINQLKRETRNGLSPPRKRLRAAWDQHYLLKVLGMSIYMRWP